MLIIRSTWATPSYCQMLQHSGLTTESGIWTHSVAIRPLHVQRHSPLYQTADKFEWNVYLFPVEMTNWGVTFPEIVPLWRRGDNLHKITHWLKKMPSIFSITSEANVNSVVNKCLFSTTYTVKYVIYILVCQTSRNGQGPFYVTKHSGPLVNSRVT